MSNNFAKRLLVKNSLATLLISGLVFAPSAMSADVQTESKIEPKKESALPSPEKTGAAPAKPAVTPPAKAKEGETSTPKEDTAKIEPGVTEAEDTTQTKADVKTPPQKSRSSKTIENRLSLGTSVGWAVIKPTKGTWTGLGASDINLQWRLSQKMDGKLFITGRYAPFAGVWTVNKRDYDTTMHGLYAGSELQVPTTIMGAATLKAGVELGYMLVYARPQDKASASGDVKGGKFNLAAGGGADWGILSNQVKVGPFVRVHAGGFSIFNLGGSARFVF